VRLLNNALWPWVLLVPRREGITEIYQLSADDQARLWRESAILGEGLMQAFNGDKLNIGALGNQVSQLHLHHIVRFQSDPAWPGPVWGCSTERQTYTEEQKIAFAARIKETLARLAQPD